jgi:hypothetical protein
MPEILNEWRAAIGDENLMWAAGGALALYVVNWCRIVQRTGRNFAWGFLMAVPGLNVLVQTLFAWTPWPVAREARELAHVRRAVHRADAHVLRKVS